MILLRVKNQVLVRNRIRMAKRVQLTRVARCSSGALKESIVKDEVG